MQKLEPTNKSPLASLRSLVATGALQQATESFAPSGGLSIACQIGRDRQFFSSNRDTSFSVDTRVDAGCIAQNLTSLLLAMAASEGRLSYEDDVAQYFREQNGIDKELRIRHLLSHSHGLDGSMFKEVPYGSDGYIDASAIWCELTATPPISRPGTRFYYWGAVGPWIAGAILERVHGRTFSDLLRETILRRIDYTPRLVGAEFRACPAAGGFGVSARELLQLSGIHLQHLSEGNSTDPIRQLGHSCDVPIPRWPPIAEGASIGWFHYRGATLGRGARRAAIFVSPAESAAMVLTGNEVVFARHRLIGRLATRDTQPPQVLTEPLSNELRLQRFVGTYRKAGLSMEILVGGDGALQARIRRRVASGLYERTPSISRQLVPAAENTFYPAQPEPQVISFIRFEDARKDESFAYAVSPLHDFRRVE